MELFESDALRFPLPSGVDLASVRVACSRFGTIERAEHVDGNISDEAEVVFFDVRDANNAATTLKPLGCTIVPQPKLKRGLTLPGSLELEVRDLDAVANVLHEDDGKGSYTVTFFDARVAARYLEREKQATAAATVEANVRDPRPPVELPPGLDIPPGFQSKSEDAVAEANGTHVCLPPGLQSISARPASMESTRIGANTSIASSKFAAHRHPSIEATGEFNVKPSSLFEQACQVRVRGLPKAILSDDMMEVIFQQANLEQDLLEYTVKLEGHTGRGEVIVSLASRVAAERCARHFNGRRWDASGVAVDATIVTPKPAESGPLSANAPVFVPMLSGLSANAPGQTMSANAPVFVPKEPAFVTALTPIGSDQSTDTGDSGSEDDKESGMSMTTFEKQLVPRSIK